MAHGHGRGLHGPLAWLLAVAAGGLIGLVLSLLLPARGEPTHATPSGIGPAPMVIEDADPGLGVASDAGEPEHGAGGDHPKGPRPSIPLVLVGPFALLLLSIACMPFVSQRLWHRHYPEFSFFFGSIVAAYYLLAYDAPGYAHGLSYGQYTMWHAALEFYAFIALVGGLYIASGGILVRVGVRGTPVANTALLAVGAVLANLVGTTGASVLLIRPFMRMNAGRLRPVHVVMFIFCVSNCAGCLTPIGDPPLYLGFLKGVPFAWTLVTLWPNWLLVNGVLLTVFYAVDRHLGPGPLGGAGTLAPAGPLVGVRGGVGLVAVGLIIAGVLVGPTLYPILKDWTFAAVGTWQIGVALIAWWLAPREVHEANGFTFEPVREVGLLFLGIFATMAPALGYLAEHAGGLGLSSPTGLYLATGTLSALLDNAPTYLTFLQVALAPDEVNTASIGAMLAAPGGNATLAAISSAAVFFGAMTYIGNAPNFMVKAIAEGAGVRMPSFFGYLLLSLSILGPVLVLHWAVFIR